MQNRLVVKAATWTRDVNGLFDYECLVPVPNDITISGPGTAVESFVGKLYRTENDVIFVPDNSLPLPVDRKFQLLATVEFVQGTFFVITSSGNYYVQGVADPSYENSLCRVLRSVKGSSSISQQVRSDSQIGVGIPPDRGDDHKAGEGEVLRQRDLQGGRHLAEGPSPGALFPDR